MWTMMLLMFGLLATSTLGAYAQEAANPTQGGGDTKAWSPDLGDSAWMLMASALVLLMTPGLAFFYGGLVRSKNMLNTLMMSFGAMGLLGVAWVVVGYSLAFGGADNNYIGNLQYAFLNGVDATSRFVDAHTIPHLLFMMFQGMFFIITPALISVRWLNA
jgi:Amt family ammonium transporter